MVSYYDYSVIPPSGTQFEKFPESFNQDNWFQNLVVPQGLSGSLSAGGWTLGNEGWPQQTFLGASIKSVSISAGFGDSSSTLALSLVEDEYNISDGFGYGEGDDAYHGGVRDIFRPPAVGSPVWFKYGQNPCDIDQAFRTRFNEIYAGYGTFDGQNYAGVQQPDEESISDLFTERTAKKDGEFELQDYEYVDIANSTETTYKVVNKSQLWNPEQPLRGLDHIAFGGILQSYTENTSTAERSAFQVNVVDPREILSNVTIILNSYQGTVFDNSNIFNLYGFLEYDVRDDLQEFFEEEADEIVVLTYSEPSSLITDKNLPDPEDPDDAEEAAARERLKNTTAAWYYPDKTDTYTFYNVNLPQELGDGPLPTVFPITGQGFARRTDAGMPIGRIVQSMNALLETDGVLPDDYLRAGFGGRINFRGFNYVVDFTGLPLSKIPYFYPFDYDTMDLLSFCLEVCEITSHDLFVELLPVIDHPVTKYLDEANQSLAEQGLGDQMLHGIIKLSAIDRTTQPEYGAVLEYLKSLKEVNIDIYYQSRCWF
jgi:hypothetical protein